MAPSQEEWYLQAEYDMVTAESLYTAKRYIHAVFMAHLALEKGLKARYLTETKKIPPKTHDLEYLIDAMQIEPPGEFYSLARQQSQVHILTRYPEELDPAAAKYNKQLTREILDKTNRFIQWIKKQP